MTPPKAIALSLLLLSSWASASAIPVQARAAASSSAVASASSAQATCGWTYFLNVDNTTTDDDDADDGEDDSTTTTSKRDEHELHQLARRGRTTNSYNNGKCALGTKIFKPQYPGPASLESMQGSAFLGYYIPKLDQCPAGAVTYDVISDSSVLTDTVAAYWDSANAGTGQKYIALGAKVSPTDSYINVDHVYELKIVDSFFSAMIAKYNFCNSFKTFFLTQDTEHPTANGVKSRLQRLYGMLPSNTYLDFVAMDNQLNSMKAPMFDENLSGMQSPKGSTSEEEANNALSIINTMATVISLLRDNKIAEVFKTTNKRIYEAFLGIDQLTTGCNDPIPGKGWADSYSSWMEEFLSTQATSVSSRLASISGQVTPTTDASGQKNALGQGLDAFNAKYPAASWTWDAKQLLDFSAPSAIAFAKRGAESSVAACTPTASVSASSSVAVVTTHAGSSAVATASHTSNIVTSKATTHTPESEISKTVHASTTVKSETSKPVTTQTIETPVTTKHSTTTTTEVAPSSSVTTTSTTSSSHTSSSTTSSSTSTTSSTSATSSTTSSAPSSTTTTTTSSTTSTTLSTTTTTLSTTTTTTTTSSKTTTTTTKTTTITAAATTKATTCKTASQCPKCGLFSKGKCSGGVCKC
ncbi:uncharacterized protein BO66DRAFT_95421 [Aspergillus aculeatinus CBS 121060]|uniref:Uncharacterized protein n=1 Tax=Aspergillus aculeatinus CBS 121060 TaxID=1448322 RepID=A0ACD1H8K8_9EURO|nr:hypothetical protein BO66DRAFT_95421 [Aspergillus aculeatinus CBS 121060]RAH69743.1 hypothetical protein BO66DRAFT_95421 [Aspergillus aculeatinus CBS 121060]